VQAELEDVLRIGGRKNGHADLGHRHFRAGRHRRRLGDGVVADQSQDPSRGGRAAEVRVADGIGRAVQTGRLAVPDPDDTVTGRRADDRGELRALHRVDAQLLVDAGTEHDVVLLQEPALSLQLEVVARQR
jgi:hypothetical protein